MIPRSLVQADQACTAQAQRSSCASVLAAVLTTGRWFEGGRRDGRTVSGKQARVVQYAFDVLVLMSEMFVSLRVRSGARRYRPSLRLPAAPYVPWEVVRVWALSNFCAEDGSLVLEMSSGGHGRDTQTQRGAEGMAEETSQEGFERLSRRLSLV